MEQCHLLFQLIVRFFSRERNEATPSSLQPRQCPTKNRHAPQQTRPSPTTAQRNHAPHPSSAIRKVCRVPRSERKRHNARNPSCPPPRQTQPHRHIPYRRAQTCDNIPLRHCETRSMVSQQGSCGATSREENAPRTWMFSVITENGPVKK